MWSSWAESAKSSVTQALDKTGDIISKAATNAGKSAREKNHTSNDNTSTPQDQLHNTNQPTIVQLPPDPKKSVSSSTDEASSTDINKNNNSTQAQTSSNTNHPNENQLLSTISQGWFNVLDATKATFKHAEEAIIEHRTAFEQNVLKSMKNNYHKRDVSLPLDVEALQDAEVVYITDRIITMGHPTCMNEIFPFVFIFEAYVSGNLIDDSYPFHFLSFLHSGLQHES